MRLRMAFRDLYPSYKETLIPSMISAMCGGALEITDEECADLIIVGPFRRKQKFIQKFRRAYRNKNAIYLFHTGENVRFNEVEADFAISFDLGVVEENHLRLPLWMDYLTWREEGLDYQPKNVRFGRPIEIEQLMVPLGRNTLKRQFKAAIFTRHLKEPRKSLIKALESVMEVDCFGGAFDPAIKSHDQSGFYKCDILRNYAFNLCPENSLYPGYCTEKIVESYAAGSIPITWADPNIKADFDEGAFINCHSFAAGGYREGLQNAVSEAMLEPLFETPLLSNRPSLRPLREFLDSVIGAASRS
jgi:hypothetical protein